MKWLGKYKEKNRPRMTLIRRMTLIKDHNKKFVVFDPFVFIRGNLL